MRKPLNGLCCSSCCGCDGCTDIRAEGSTSRGSAGNCVDTTNGLLCNDAGNVALRLIGGVCRASVAVMVDANDIFRSKSGLDRGFA
jgi:hypothetical protein